MIFNNILKLKIIRVHMGSNMYDYNITNMRKGKDPILIASALMHKKTKLVCKSSD